LKGVIKSFLPDCTVLKITEYGEPSLRIVMKDGRYKPNPKTYWGKRINDWKEDMKNLPIMDGYKMEDYKPRGLKPRIKISEIQVVG